MEYPVAHPTLKTKPSLRKAVEKYQEKNHEAILLKKKEKRNCVFCDKQVSYSNLWRHVKKCEKNEYDLPPMELVPLFG